MAFKDNLAALTIVSAALLMTTTAGQGNSGYATYSSNNGGVCSGSSNGLPGVAMNAAQFGGGSACGQCVQIQGTGNGAGGNPVSTAPYIAVVTNVCGPCAPGDIDLQESGDGKFGISWSFVPCPGSGRKLIEEEEQTESVQESEAEASSPSTSEEEPLVDVAAPTQLEVTESSSEELTAASPVSSNVPQAEEEPVEEVSAPVTAPAQSQEPVVTSRKLLRS